jgi:hypothetical protein
LLKKQRFLFVFCLLAIGLTAFGFNTFDWMLGNFYWTNNVNPAPVLVNLVVVSWFVNAWDFYFFYFLVPLWVGGFCVGFAAVAHFFKLKF